MVGIFCSSAVVHAGAYMTKTEALILAFGESAQVETANLFLTETELDEITKRSGVRPDSALYTLYVGKAENSVVGYAAIEAATVRTHPETVLVVLDPKGQVRFVEILAFFEPEEYLPSKRWLDQFKGRRLSSTLKVSAEIQGITGATLSAQAVTRQVRKTAAILNKYLERSE
jgi:Na+-translocating ferredoxin:NAD+ oxidoreductase RnfG subunit